ncbi:pyridoxal-dependent decarboxylase [Bacteroidota bacterium]
MTYKFWQKKTQEEIKATVNKALKQNVNYVEEDIIGIPASYLDEKVFNKDESFLKDAPFMSALVQNPNHIGCHTLGKSESIFSGTQEIEKDLIEICAVDILKGEPKKQDGYVASGGTEANIQAIWAYRNYYMSESSAKLDDICIICTEDSHYSMDKASNLLSISIYKIPVEEETREVTEQTLSETLKQAKSEGKKHFIVVCNMMTTMFGSVDNVDLFTEQLSALNCDFKLHVDGAYGGFYYPFSDQNNKLSFENPAITSFTLDAHKMAQAPYGTGIFLIRKGYLGYVNTKAGYLEGEDLTLIGSRSGANTISVWMILAKYGPYGWFEKIYILQKRTSWLCEQLEQLGVTYYRNPNSNIVTIKNGCIPQYIIDKFGLVSDSQSKPNWFKVVIMEHATLDKLAKLVDEIKKYQKGKLN